MKECGVADKVTLIKHKDLYRAIYPGVDVTVPAGWDRFTKTMKEKFTFILLLLLIPAFAFAGHGHKRTMKKGILLVAFGSSMPEAQISFENIDKKIKKVVDKIIKNY